MASVMLKKLVCFVVVCMVVQALVMPNGVEAALTTCGAVTKYLGQCMPFLRGTAGGVPSPKCCAGVGGLKAAAQTTADRRMACNCMKSTASKTKGLNYNFASRLASLCRVPVSYSFNPKINCNRGKSWLQTGMPKNNNAKITSSENHDHIVIMTITLQSSKHMPLRPSQKLSSGLRYTYTDTLQEMAAISLLKLARVVAAICMVLGASSCATEAAISCSGVSDTLSPCVPHLKSSGPTQATPPENCCAGLAPKDSTMTLQLSFLHIVGLACLTPSASALTAPT
uniref:Non-specific lipid-transfer protein n=1 Tax=Chenopodium quinoa TaxID=63459 RepID=A0A803L3E7_CHEQI